MDSKHRYSKLIYAFGIAGQLGFSVVIPLAGLIFLGAFLDKKLNVFPNFLLLGLFSGLAIAIYESYKFLKPLIK
ncbi:AtpZ/AtpI family protein [bacterium]|nr:AtpZ/AtpI family protein [bacterium]